MSIIRTASGLAEAWATAVVLAVAHLTHPLRARFRARRRRPMTGLCQIIASDAPLPPRPASGSRPGQRVPEDYVVARESLDPFIEAQARRRLDESPFRSRLEAALGELPPLSPAAQAELDALNARGRRVRELRRQAEFAERSRKSMAKYRY